MKILLAAAAAIQTAKKLGVLKGHDRRFEGARLDSLRKNSDGQRFVSGHDFSRAVKAVKSMVFSPCGMLLPVNWPHAPLFFRKLSSRAVSSPKSIGPLGPRGRSPRFWSKIGSFSAACIALSLPLAAQTTPGAVVFPVGDLRAQLAQYISQAQQKGSAGATLENYGTTALQLSVLGKSSAAEAQPHWDRILVVEQGSATLVTGGRIVSPRRDAAGNTRGTRIAGGRAAIVAAGDIVSIPAGTPHQLLLAPGSVFSAFVIRIHEP